MNKCILGLLLSLSWLNVNAQDLGTFDPDRVLSHDCQETVGCHPGPSTNVYWVDNSGSDNNPGGNAKPLQNINTAINKIPENSGGTICVNDGVYNEDVRFPISGTVGEQLE